ncbi:MAG: hypothetical protein FWG82_02295 [Oscillospiraceae bacterium]|nr:hypothetical protein [Oscillospiraceae bacterium]
MAAFFTSIVEALQTFFNNLGFTGGWSDTWNGYFAEMYEWIDNAWWNGLWDKL